MMVILIFFFKGYYPILYTWVVNEEVETCGNYYYNQEMVWYIDRDEVYPEFFTIRYVFQGVELYLVNDVNHSNFFLSNDTNGSWWFFTEMEPQPFLAVCDFNSDCLSNICDEGNCVDFVNEFFVVLAFAIVSPTVIVLVVMGVVQAIRNRGEMERRVLEENREKIA